MITTHNELIAHVKKKTWKNNVLLSFSGGKDAWATWIAIRDHFEVTPFFYYIVPHLSFIDEYMAYCEKKLGCKIWQYPHPGTMEMLFSFSFQPPERSFLLFEYMGLKEPFSKEECAKSCEADSGKPVDSCYTALGLRAADSIMRATHFRTHGPVNDKTKKFSPVWDWKKPRLIEALKKDNIKLSKEYLWFGRTMDTPVLLYLWNLKKYSPEDYKKVLEFFPLLESEIWRYERFLKNGGRNAQ